MVKIKVMATKWEIKGLSIYPIKFNDNIDYTVEAEKVLKHVKNYYKVLYNSVPNIRLIAMYNNGKFEKFYINKISK
jgi:sulfur relay (sulfurtransferase) DsrC/TusE family protein